MIQHKVSIALAREVTVLEHSSLPSVPEIHMSISNQWQILITGNIEDDDPINTSKLIKELQEQVERIRKAYSPNHDANA